MQEKTLVTTICSFVVRIGGSLALLLGLLHYFNIGPDLVQLHITLGILVVLALWILATIYARTASANLGMAIGSSVIGLLLLIVGVTQRGLLLNGYHWVIQLIHVLLGVAAIGMGETLSGAIRRTPAVV
jgi:hypothetical protein